MGTSRGEQAEPPSGPARELLDLYRGLRASRGLSYGQITSRTGLSKSYISEVFNGRKTPSPHTARKLAEALGATATVAQRAQMHAEDLAELNRHQRKTARLRPAEGSVIPRRPDQEEAGPAAVPAPPRSSARVSSPRAAGGLRSLGMAMFIWLMVILSADVSPPALGKATARPSAASVASPAGQVARQAGSARYFNLENGNVDVNYIPRCLDIRNGVAGAWDCQFNHISHPEQAWSWGKSRSDASGQYYQMVNRNGLCLGVDASSVVAGAHIVGRPCNGSPDQYWRLDGKKLISYNSWNNGFRKPPGVIGVSAGSLINGAPLILWPADDTDNQVWLESNR
jgi:transcriptional regulator with XRE-family HTH domain